MSNENTPDPYAVAAAALKDVIDTEFAAEGVHAIHDQVHPSLGSERVTVGVAPVSESTRLGNSVTNVFALEVRFLDLWDQEIDPEQTVNPMKITGYANRLKRALHQVHFEGTTEVWFFNWVRTEYPDDPTGNKTRFYMRIEFMGDNTTLVETR